MAPAGGDGFGRRRTGAVRKRGWVHPAAALLNAQLEVCDCHHNDPEEGGADGKTAT